MRLRFSLSDNFVRVDDMAMGAAMLARVHFEQRRHGGTAREGSGRAEGGLEKIASLHFGCSCSFRGRIGFSCRFYVTRSRRRWIAAQVCPALAPP